MAKEQIFEDLANAVVNRDAGLAKNTAELALAEGVDPVEAINEGLVRGMNAVGERFAARQVYLPQVLASSRSLYAGLDVLLPAIPTDRLTGAKKAGTVVVEGDVHDIGKNILRTLLTASGYVVTDLGKDVPSDEVAEKVREESLDVLCVSTIMSPTMERMPEIIDLLKENGARSHVTVTIGGPPTSHSFAERIGADHRDDNAQDAVDWLRSVQ
ncbi:MAG: cobalamin-dependent protein [Thermoplasmata archaeon]|nr:cobalamin-dependent protein [Thermoplasmata archaeon]